LNLSAPSWKLEEGEASEVLGLDVNYPELFRPDPGRIFRSSLQVHSRVFDTNSSPIVCAGLFQAEASISKTIQFTLEDVHVASIIPSAAYDPSTGIITASSAFISYVFREGDTLTVNAPASLREFYDLPFVGSGIVPPRVGFKVLEKIDNDQIRITTTSHSPISTSLYGHVIRDLPAYYPFGNFRIIKSPRLILNERITFRFGLPGAIFSSGFDDDGSWPEDVERGSVFVNSDRRKGPYETASVIERTTFGSLNDTIDMSALADAPGEGEKVRVIFPKVVDRRGVWVSDGRRFWILSLDRWRLIADLGSDDFLGAVWRASRIAENRYLFVSPTFAPRVIHLDKPFLDEDNISPDEDQVLSGCVAPRKPRTEWLDSRVDGTGKVKNPSWLADPIVSEPDYGNIDAGTDLEIYVRAVNEEDQIASSFVAVAEGAGGKQAAPPYTSTEDQKIVIQEAPPVAYGVLVFPAELGTDLDPPPWHRRMRTVEVWRTRSGGPTLPYGPESFIQVDEKGESGGSGFRMGVAVDPGRGEGCPVRLADENVSGLPRSLGLADFSSGGLPPICRDVLSLGGVTLCFGRADSDPEKPIVYSRNFHTVSCSYDSSNDQVNVSSPANFFLEYTYKDGDQLVVTYGGNDTSRILYDFDSRIPEAVYDIEDKIDNETIEIDTTGLDLPTVGQASIKAYIRRPIEILWPVVSDDEQVHYSRTDAFGPENFPFRRDPEYLPLTITLSKRGDIFQRAVLVGNYAAVIMQEGVHLLRKEGLSIIKDTVADAGAGTTWPDSVVVVENMVFWASITGIKVMVVTNDVTDEGFRARISTFLGKEIEPWFRAADTDGDSVDAGYDPRNHSLRFRRRNETTGWTEAMAISLRFQSGKRPLVSLLKSDEGFVYVPASHAVKSSDGKFRLYSISKYGNVCEVYNEDGFPFEDTDYVLRGTLEWEHGKGFYGDYMWDRNGIWFNSRDGVPTKEVFTHSMQGHTIILWNDRGVYEVREIRTAAGIDPPQGFSPNKIGFDRVNGLFGGTQFLIAPRDFRIRQAPVQGLNPGKVKTIDSVSVRARRGDLTSGDLTLRTYKNHGEAGERVPSTVSDTDTMPVFDDSDTGRTSTHRVSSIEGQGTAVAIEVESLDPKHDFRLDAVEMSVTEEVSEKADEVT
jgi:hypothetical protein